jgi:hypothetical protein
VCAHWKEKNSSWTGETQHECVGRGRKEKKSDNNNLPVDRAVKVLFIIFLLQNKLILDQVIRLRKMKTMHSVLYLKNTFYFT